jgi:RNA polymerase sigma-70 factor (ECF subfamily)
MFEPVLYCSHSLDPETVRSAWDQGRLALPKVRLAEDAFARGLDALGVAPADLQERPGDLFLAVACLGGDNAALAEFDRSFVASIPRHVASFRLGAAQLADLQQDLRVRLLAGDRPRLATYSGRASLAAWMRVIAIRVALDMAAARDRPQSEVPSLEDLVASYSSPDVRVARESLRPKLQEALRESFATLSPQERTLLRLHFIDGLNIDAIGRVFRVHRSTVGRWLVTVRSQIFEHVRKELSLDFKPTASEVRSIFRLVKSDLRLSIDRLLPG